MKKSTLIKFYNGEATEQEIDEIILWVEKSPNNKKYFSQLKAIYSVLQTGAKEYLEQRGDIPELPVKKTSYFGRRLFRVAVAVAVCAIFFSIGLLFNSNRNSLLEGESGVNGISKQKLSNVIEYELYTEKGVKGFLVLPDSSKVWLNSDSKIIYPEHFTGSSRNVKLIGEAYFEVKKDPDNPMIVSTNKDFSIEVLGTSFNLKCYNNDDNIEATLYSGVIKAKCGNGLQKEATTIELKPNESFVYKAQDVSQIKEVTQDYKLLNYPEPENVKAWKEGLLIFDKTPMPEVLKMLERWHGTSFIVNNKNIYSYKLSAEFSSESIVQVLEIMKLIMPIDYTYNKNVVTLK